MEMGEFFDFVVARDHLPLVSKCTAKQRMVIDSTWLVSVM